MFNGVPNTSLFVILFNTSWVHLNLQDHLSKEYWQIILELNYFFYYHLLEIFTEEFFEKFLQKVLLK